MKPGYKHAAPNGVIPSSQSWETSKLAPTAFRRSGGRGQVAVPEGHARIAQRFNAGKGVPGESSPEGTVEWAERAVELSRPFGTNPRGHAHPALKRWAILACPSGTWTSINPGKPFRSVLRPPPLAPPPSTFGLRPSFGLRTSDFGFHLIALLFVALCFGPTPVSAISPEALFQSGTTAYRAGDYVHAAEAFQQSVALQPASGTLQDLGNAEWRCQHTGAAILAWEQARWLDPFNASARQNLSFARKTAQLEAPELTWYEVVSTWLPANWWAWIAGTSLWLAVGMGILPGVLRQRKATWHQAVAALSLMVFLLSVPAHIGVQTRARIGFVLQKDTPLRLTPTLEAQATTRLAAGDPGRWVRSRGNYVLIRTSRTLGWVEREQFGTACPRTEKKAG